MDSLFAKFEFSGFEPTSDVRQLADLILGEISGDSPSDATAIARLERNSGGHFKGVVKICSLTGVFAVDLATGDPLQTLDGLRRLIRKQIKRWRSSRKIEVL